MRAKTQFSTQYPHELDDLAEQVGDFIQYWGFKKVHGRIWTHLFVSDHPLDAGDLCKRLKISKALVSMSIADLLEYEVIQEVGKGEQGTLQYCANPDVTRVIFNVLRRRERKLMASIESAHQLLEKSANLDQTGNQGLDSARIHYMGEMISTAKAALETLIAMGPAEGAEITDRFQSMTDVLSLISQTPTQNPQRSK
jgi:DNA-binding transcriptional regulator GbsR (MarR family)